MNNYIILLHNNIGALQWTGEAANEEEAYEKFACGSLTFDHSSEKRNDFTILQVTRDERVAVEAWDDNGGSVSPDGSIGGPQEVIDTLREIVRRYGCQVE